jgi:hypothetical protein
MTEQKFPTYLNDCFMCTAEYDGSINTTTACMYISILLTVILDEILARCGGFGIRRRIFVVVF